MPNKLVVAESASRDIAAFFDYLSGYNIQLAMGVVNDIGRVLRNDVTINPTLYRWSDLAGRPYRGRLYRVSHRTQYWIIYRHDPEASEVKVVRFWNASRDPSTFEL
jgi:plasmid stabilization system protein ParE